MVAWEMSNASQQGLQVDRGGVFPRRSRRRSRLWRWCSSDAACTRAGHMVMMMVVMVMMMMP